MGHRPVVSGADELGQQTLKFPKLREREILGSGKRQVQPLQRSGSQSQRCALSAEDEDLPGRYALRHQGLHAVGYMMSLAFAKHAFCLGAGLRERRSPLQEQLIAKMEALASVEDPSDAARQLRELQHEWQKVATVPREQGQAL